MTKTLYYSRPNKGQNVTTKLRSTVPGSIRTMDTFKLVQKYIMQIEIYTAGEFRTESTSVIFTYINRLLVFLLYNPENYFVYFL